MPGPFEAVKISENVFWVGAIDWGVRNFHGYATSRGTTYNAYLVMADKITLIDAVKAPFRDELLSRISSVVDLKSIDYVVSNHSELDHSGCLFDVVKLAGPERVYASPNGVKALDAHFHNDFPVEALGDGDAVDLGSARLTAVLTPMVHWPDSMITYLDCDRMLFTQDGFGLHLASHERFADELPEDIVDFETAKYFANILMPFSLQIKKVLDKLEKLSLPVDFLANDHGPIWRGDVTGVIGKYRRWAEQEQGRKALVVYDTMWNSTDLMGRAIGDGIASRGVKVEVMPLSACHRSDIATELLEAGALVVGSPTLNSQMFPTVADILCYLKGLKPRNLVGAAFGSYGWSGQAPGLILNALEEMKIDVMDEPLRIKYVPSSDTVRNCHEFGERIGDRLLEKL